MYVIIKEETFPIDTDREISEARLALLDAGLEKAYVYAGDPYCPGSYRTSSVLLADANKSLDKRAA